MKYIKDLGMIYATQNSKVKRHYAVYECACGKQFRSDVANIKHNGVFQCMECSRIKHGYTGTRIHRIWMSMKRRCNPNTLDLHHKKYYSDKGIFVCNEWNNSFETFLEWSKANGYNDSKSIDRIDGNKNYEPSNCRWVSKIIQSQNTKLIHSTNTSGFRGVSWNKKAQKYSAQIYHNKKKIYFGLFIDAVDGAKVVDKYIIKHGMKNPLNLKASA